MLISQNTPPIYGSFIAEKVVFMSIMAGNMCISPIVKRERERACFSMFLTVNNGQKYV